jgi:hypothetical protein
MTCSELDPRTMDKFARLLLEGGSRRVRGAELWRALARLFPHRAAGPRERTLLLDLLRTLAARGSIRLPAERGKRWDRTMDPAIPTSVDLVRGQSPSPSLSWREFPWHPRLQWVAQHRRLSAQQIDFLRRVHDGFVNGLFREPAPLKYRSLQLTGDEKLLASLAKTSLFGESRLTLDMLACSLDALPLAWEPVGEGGRMLIFENAGPFAVARRVLGKLTRRPYDMVAYGGGRGVLAAIGHIRSITPRVESLHYVGDLDYAGLDIASGLRKCSKELGLPTVEPASELHRQMLATAAAFGYAHGWPGRKRADREQARRVLGALSDDVRDRVEDLLTEGRRIPEEVLGPDELRRTWRGGW